MLSISDDDNDQMLFAYFPGRGGDGAGCIWQRGKQLNNWRVRECWDIEQGAGVVTAEWTNAHREVHPSVYNWRVMLADSLGSGQ